MIFRDRHVYHIMKKDAITKGLLKNRCKIQWLFLHSWLQNRMLYEWTRHQVVQAVNHKHLRMLERIAEGSLRMVHQLFKIRQLNLSCRLSSQCSRCSRWHLKSSVLKHDTLTGVVCHVDGQGQCFIDTRNPLSKIDYYPKISRNTFITTYWPRTHKMCSQMRVLCLDTLKKIESDCISEYVDGK